MTRLDTLKSLQKRIQEATGADRELDALIAAAFLGGEAYHMPAGYEGFRWVRRDTVDSAVFGPEPYTSDPDGLGACVALCREVLPGYAWKVGTCCVSDDAWVVPDFNCPVHGDRLREKFGEIEWGSIWDTGIDIDRRPSGNVCLAFLDAIVSALIAEEEAKEKADV